MDYIVRGLEDKFLEFSGFFKVVMLTGARQVGKTTMLRRLAERTNRTCVSLDDPRLRRMAQNDPELFLQTYEPPVLIDEVQYAPGLFPYLKILADESEEPGRIWLTGSQHYGAIKGMRESLAGRIGLLRMHSLSQAEILGADLAQGLEFNAAFWERRARERGEQKAADVFARIWRGGMPAAQDLDARLREGYFDSYVDTYLMRDVIELGGVADRAKFRAFLTAAAALIGRQLNYSRLVEATGISQSTAKKWIGLLAELGIVYLLAPFASDRLKRLARTPELYFEDTGLAAYLTEWPNPDTLGAGPMSGAFLENYAVMEFVCAYGYGPLTARFSYYRDANRKEIDLLIHEGGLAHPIEIKQSASPDIREARKFQALDASGVARGQGGIACLTREALPIDRENCWIPISAI